MFLQNTNFDKLQYKLYYNYKLPSTYVTYLFTVRCWIFNSSSSSSIPGKAFRSKRSIEIITLKSKVKEQKQWHFSEISYSTTFGSRTAPKTSYQPFTVRFVHFPMVSGLKTTFLNDTVGTGRGIGEVNKKVW